MTGAGCGEIRRALGVYLLGAIDPAGRADVDSHLTECAACREELAGLAALPGRLGSVPAADVTWMALDEAAVAGQDCTGLPEVRLRPLLERAAALRRHLMWRRVVVAASAAVVIAGGSAVAVSRALGPPAPWPAAPALPWTAAVHGGDWRTGAAATVRHLPQPWGCNCRSRSAGSPQGRSARCRCSAQAGGK